jgi:hypothetical protein
MAIKPLQSDQSISVRKSEKPTASSSPRRSEEARDGFKAKFDESQAVQVTLQSKRSDKAPPPPPPPPPYTASPKAKERNFKDIDSDSNGELSKEELTSAQERRQAEGKRTPLIDKALASYDQQTQASGKSGISYEEFFKKDQAPPPPPPQRENSESLVKES